VRDDWHALAPAQHRRLRELHLGQGSGGARGRVGRARRPPHGAQGPLGPDELLPTQREHPAQRTGADITPTRERPLPPFVNATYYSRPRSENEPRERPDRGLGDKCWGQVRGFPGSLRERRRRGETGTENGPGAGKTRRQAAFLDIDGKEGVSGSSPEEGFAKSAAYRPLPFAIRTMDSLRNVHQTSTEWPQRSASSAHTGFLTAFRLLVAASTQRPRGGCGIVCGE
jgi:hypothetical protein